MATVSLIPSVTSNGYPTSDRRIMSETEWHREMMNVLIAILKAFYQAQPLVYVSGDMLLFYERGNKRRHVSPDVFVVKGVDKKVRPNYLLWQEGKGPNIVIELTSSSTRRTDTTRKFALYQNTLKVKEYFLFDGHKEYLDPSLRGYRLRKGVYQPIRPVKGRLPSRVLGLHLERDGDQLCLYNPATQQWLLPPVVVQQQRAEQAERAQQQERQAREQAERTQQRAEAELERLRREIEELRRRMSEQN